MKEFIQRFVSFIGLFYPYKLHQEILKKRNFIYTCWLSNFFSQMGDGTRFEYKIHAKGGQYIKIGKKCLFYRGNIINAWDTYNGHKFTPQITIGDNCSFGAYSQITACKSVQIGNNLLTGAYVLISDNNHGSFVEDDLKKDPRKRDLHYKGVIIGNNVWLGDKVAVLSGVQIGDGVVVAANAVVTKDIPPYCLAAGVPAKVIKQIDVQI